MVQQKGNSSEHAKLNYDISCKNLKDKIIKNARWPLIFLSKLKERVHARFKCVSAQSTYESHKDE